MKYCLVSFLLSLFAHGKSHAIIKDRKGNTLGKVIFMNYENGLKITGKIKGLSKNSLHGFHIHEKGKCQGDFKTAGSHFDPYKISKHGSLTATSHAGDLGNIKTNSAGVAKFDKYKKGIKETEIGGENNENKTYSIIGKAVIIHAENDKFDPQPSGAAGERIACGVISYLKV